MAFQPQQQEEEKGILYVQMFDEATGKFYLGACSMPASSFDDPNTVFPTKAVKADQCLKDTSAAATTGRGAEDPRHGMAMVKKTGEVWPTTKVPKYATALGVEMQQGGNGDMPADVVPYCYVISATSEVGSYDAGYDTSDLHPEGNDKSAFLQQRYPNCRFAMLSGYGPIVDEEQKNQACQFLLWGEELLFPKMGLVGQSTEIRQKKDKMIQTALRGRDTMDVAKANMKFVPGPNGGIRVETANLEVAKMLANSGVCGGMTAKAVPCSDDEEDEQQPQQQLQHPKMMDNGNNGNSNFCDNQNHAQDHAHAQPATDDDSSDSDEDADRNDYRNDYRNDPNTVVIHMGTIGGGGDHGRGRDMSGDEDNNCFAAIVGAVVVGVLFVLVGCWWAYKHNWCGSSRSGVHGGEADGNPLGGGHGFSLGAAMNQYQQGGGGGSPGFAPAPAFRRRDLGRQQHMAGQPGLENTFSAMGQRAGGAFGAGMPTNSSGMEDTDALASLPAVGDDDFHERVRGFVLNQNQQVQREIARQRGTVSGLHFQ